MRYEDIARAPQKLEDSGVHLEGTFLALNAWLYGRSRDTEPRHPTISSGRHRL
jgi:hypothetical protein